MTPAADVAFVAAVLELYLDLPDTPLRFHSADQALAQRLSQRQISLKVIEAALLLGSLRRLMRPSSLPPLTRIRSLAYFQPVIDELLLQPLSDSYLQHLRLKLRAVSPLSPASVQNSTFSGDR